MRFIFEIIRIENAGKMRGKTGVLFLGEGNLHGRVGGDLEALEGVSGGAGLELIFEFDKGNVVTTRNQTNLLESGKLERKMYNETSSRILACKNRTWRSKANGK
jgi:hypothetical protein